MSQDTDPTDFTPPTIEEIAALLPAYEILSFIAKGGMGVVYRANQKSLDREVAIKVLPRHFGEDEEFRASFELEAKSMAKLNHPNLIGIYDFGQVDGLLYIIMEMVQGKPLYYSAYGKTIDPDEAARIITGICNGLSSAHDHGLLHRDIKPSNILLDTQASPKIGDFGLVRPVGDHESDSSFGTPGYTAPEVVHNPALVDESTDIYSVGVMLYELLTSKLPDEVYTPASNLVACDPRFDQIIRKATHPTPAMRYRRAEDMAKALDEIKSSPSLLIKTQAHTLSSKTSRTLVTSGAEAQPPKLNTELDENNSPAGATPHKRPAIPAKPAVTTTGSNASLIRNIIIIIGLLAAIFIAWESLKSMRTQRAEEQAEATALEEAKQKEREQKKKNAAAAQNNDPSQAVREKQSANSLSPIAPNIETPREALTRLRSQLARGIRSEMPKGCTTSGERTRMYIADQMTWHEAQAFCERHGGHLAVLPEMSDLQKLSSKLKSDQLIWLGAGSAGKNQWRWIDGTEWKQEIRKTSKSSYVAVDDTSILQPQPASNKNSFFIEWLMDGTMPASLENQLKRCADSLDSSQPLFPAGTISYDNRYYLLIKKSSDWKTADSLAKAGKGNLAVPSNPDESIWLLEFLAPALQSGQACWIGGYRPSGKAWQWATGEPWKFAKWTKGAPNENSKTISGCAVHPSQTWDDHPADTSLSHFIIEWGKDDQSHQIVKATGVVDDKLSPLRHKCADLIVGIKKKHEKSFTNNIKGYEQELHRFIRSQTKSVRETYTPEIVSMTSSYPENRIPSDILRTNMPAKVAKILDSRLTKQARLQAIYLSEIETLRTKYHRNLEKMLKNLESKGLKSRSRLIKGELDKTVDPESFIKHVLPAK